MDRFRHYYRVDHQWYEFRFLGPTRDRRHPGASPTAHGDYYLAVEYQRVSATVVPSDRRHHRPGHLLRGLRGLRQTASSAIAPVRSPDFTGRRNELYEALQRLVRATPTLSIQGLPGVGKTEFVATLVDATAGKYRDGHIYLQASLAGHRRSVADLLRTAIVALDPNVALADDERALAAQYRSLVRDRECLVICEDVVAADDVLPFLPHARGALIVTSRAVLSLPGAPEPLVLPTFSPDIAARFLQEIAPRVDVAARDDLVDATRRAVRDHDSRELLTVAHVITALCGDLPLALRICGRYLTQHPDIEPHAFAHSVIDRRRLLTLRGARTETVSVEAVIAVSYDALTIDEQAAFRRLGTFASSFGRAAAIMVGHDPTRLSEDTAPPLVSDLVQQGLVSFDVHNGRYRLHELVRAFAVARQTEIERAEALLDLADYYVYFAGRHSLAAVHGRPAELIATEPTFVQELPNVALVVETLLAPTPALEHIYSASDIVLGLAPFLLRFSSEEFLAWSERLVRALEPLARVGFVHTQSRPTARAHVHAGNDWGSSGMRLMHHAYHCGLALEAKWEEDAEARAVACYSAVATTRETLGMSDARSAQVRSWMWIRMARLVRRRGTASDVIEITSKRRAYAAEIGAPDQVLTDIIQAHAYVERGNPDEAARVIQELLRLCRLMRVPVPWAAAFYLDALSEHSPAWFWAYHLHTAEEGNRLILTLSDHVMQTGAAPERPVDATLEDVRRHFRMHPVDRLRTPYPVLPGAVLLALDQPREALRFYEAAIRVATWVSDVDGLIAALEQRARANERLGAFDHAIGDWEELLQLQSNPAWEHARDHVRSLAATRSRSIPSSHRRQRRRRRQ